MAPHASSSVTSAGGQYYNGNSDGKSHESKSSRSSRVKQSSVESMSFMSMETMLDSRF